MRKKIFYFLSVGLLCVQFTLYAQKKVVYSTPLKDEQRWFGEILRSVSRDTSIVYPMNRYFQSGINDIYTLITADAGLNTGEKEKAIRSIVFFIKELGFNLQKQKQDMYDIPGALQSYRSILTALLYHKPVSPMLPALGPRRSQIMAAAFTQYKEYNLLDDVAVYKRVASAPEFIIQFLESKPGFRFADSLLLDVAAYDPQRIVFYLKDDRPGIQDKIRNSRNLYLEQVVAVADDKSASEILPFIVQLAEKKLTADEIREKRMEPLNYFQLMVNSLLDAERNGDPQAVFLKPLRTGIKQKSLAFYVNQVNELHSSPDAIRFASVKGLRAEDLYYIITSCGDDLYTSSYLGLYKRLMEQFKDRPADSLFDIVQHDNLRTFIRLAANYNVLADFLSKLSPDRSHDIMHRFISNIEAETSSGLEKAMDIADAFTALSASPEINDFVRTELRSNLQRCTHDQLYLGIRLYNILLQVQDLVDQKNGMHGLWSTLGNYEILKRNQLENQQKQIAQVVLFYGDEDGVASFDNFLRFYTDTKKWEITKNNNWVSIRSVSESPLIIFANRPLEMKTEMDLRAQDSLFDYLSQNSLEPTVLVHRGHSYHLDKTLKRLTPFVKLAILGSCGGYNKTISIATMNPDVQVIGSKKTGSMSINDPIINEIDEALVKKEDLEWPEIWKRLETRFAKDENLRNQFAEYFPPSDNVGLFVLKLYNYYNHFL